MVSEALVLIGSEVTCLEDHNKWYALLFSLRTFISPQEEYLKVQIQVHYFFLICTSDFQKLSGPIMLADDSNVFIQNAKTSFQQSTT